MNNISNNLLTSFSSSVLHERVAIIMIDKWNAELLAKYLSTHYQVIRSEPGSFPTQSFDVAVIDSASMQVLQNEIEQHQYAVRPRVVPFLLATTRQGLLRWTEGELQSLAMDVIVVPVEKAELLVRTKVLLKIAQYSKELNVAYERFVPQEFLHCLGKNNVVDVHLGDQVEREMTIMFSDIRDFTPLAESLSPQEVFDFLNSYLGQMEPIISEYHGFIDKYIGDAIMALFPTHADDAVSSAVSMLKNLRKYNELLARSEYPMINIGIGLNTGPLILGTVGGQHRMDGTVISDAVNLAARTEELTKKYYTKLLITENTYNKLQDPSKYQIRKLDRVKVKGKSKIVTIYEVFDADTENLIALKQQTSSDFELGVQLYHEDKCDEAYHYFKTTLQINPDDKVAEVYLQRCARPQNRHESETFIDSKFTL
jgi:class 3 adenylate cyclase